MTPPSITVPVDLTNPGHFFACCGLLELADRLCPGAEGWFSGDRFHLAAGDLTIHSIVKHLREAVVTNTMSVTQQQRMAGLKSKKREKGADRELDEELKSLESLRRELPVSLSGVFSVVVDWFTDDLAGGSRFKTWAGQQSVLDIAQTMHAGIAATDVNSEADLWATSRGSGLPFNFDSDLGGQGSALDIGFSFDPLAANEATRIEGKCRPLLELLCFIGLQRFRPSEIPRQNQYIYAAWQTPAQVSVASALASGSIRPGPYPRFSFPLLYRTKYLKSFLPARIYLGEHHE